MTKTTYYKLWIIILLLGFLISLIYYQKTYFKNQFMLSFLDIGQGDSILIRTKNNQTILVDGGVDKRIISKLQYKLGFLDRTIDMVVMTHQDKDHFGGLIDVFKQYQVKSILMTGVKDTENVAYQQILELIQQEGCTIIPAVVGEEIVIEDLKLTVLNPQEDLWNQTVKHDNNSSIVLRGEYRGTNFLLTGDIEKEQERILIQKNLPIQATILKAGHHGSKTSTSEEFLLKVNPAKVILSAGKDNPFHHPAPEVLSLLTKHSIQSYVTYLTGDVDFYQ